MKLLSEDGKDKSIKPISELLFGKFKLDKRGRILKSNFVVYKPQTLFGSDWGALLLKRCPWCHNKLKESRDKKSLSCRSKKHQKPFFITHRKFTELSTQLSTPKNGSIEPQNI